MGSLARAGLSRHDTAGRADPARGEQRVVAVVGADVDEHHAGLQHPVEEGELVGFEGAADIEAEAVVVAQRQVDRGPAVPPHGDRHRKLLLAGSFPEGAAPAGQPATLIVVLLGEHPARSRAQARHARGKGSRVSRADGRRIHDQPATEIVEVVANTGADPVPGAWGADRSASGRHSSNRCPPLLVACPNPCAVFG
jgi:hypothetical protein